jgi:hypothetical protein
MLAAGVGVSQTSGGSPQAPAGPVGKVTDYLFDYLTMAGAQKAADFRPLTQRERTHLYVKSMWNPIGFLKVAVSAGRDHLNNKPVEWGQGWSAYGRRAANIEGQYAIQKTVTFGFSSLLHEDNRYFGSGKKGIWRRTGYAMSSSVLARHDNGRRYVSISQLAGFSGAAFLSRLWQPASTNSAGDGAVSFGISMGCNMGISVLKEFLPDILRPFLKNRNATG